MSPHCSEVGFGERVECLCDARSDVSPPVSDHQCGAGRGGEFPVPIPIDVDAAEDAQQAVLRRAEGVDGEHVDAVRIRGRRAPVEVHARVFKVAERGDDAPD